MTFRKTMLLSLVACVSFCLFHVITPYAQQQVYYIDDGRSQIQSVRGNPDDVQAEEWYIRLYKFGASTGGDDHWGSIRGKSAQDVIRKLREGQEIQKRCAKWTGTDYTTYTLTYFNYLGPIAKIRPPKPPAARILTGLNKAIETLKRLREGFTKLEQILADKVKPNNPFSDVGRVTQDYANALSQAEKMVASFQRNFTAFTDKTAIELSWELERVAKSIEIAESKFSAVQSLVPALQPASARDDNECPNGYQPGKSSADLDKCREDVRRCEDACGCGPSSGCACLCPDRCRRWICKSDR